MGVNGVTYQRVCFAARPVRHHPERALDDGIIGPRWLTRDELAAIKRNPERRPGVSASSA